MFTGTVFTATFVGWRHLFIHNIYHLLYNVTGISFFDFRYSTGFKMMLHDNAVGVFECGLHCLRLVDDVDAVAPAFDHVDDGL